MATGCQTLEEGPPSHQTAVWQKPQGESPPLGAETTRPHINGDDLEKFLATKTS